MSNELHQTSPLDRFKVRCIKECKDFIVGNIYEVQDLDRTGRSGMGVFIFHDGISTDVSRYEYNQCFEIVKE